MILVAAVVFSGSTPTYADDATRPDFEGTWLSPLIIFDDPRWRIEDVLCQYCAVESFEYLQGLLADPANDDRSIVEIGDDANRFNEAYYNSLLTTEGQRHYAEFDPADDPVNTCEPAGFIRQVLQPLPMKIEQYDDRVVFRFEYENTVREVHMDGREHPADLTPSRLGHAIGWYDGDTLAVETRGIAPAVYAHIVGKGYWNTSGAVTIERYTKSADVETTRYRAYCRRPRVSAQAPGDLLRLAFNTRRGISGVQMRSDNRGAMSARDGTRKGRKQAITAICRISGLIVARGSLVNACPCPPCVHASHYDVSKVTQVEGVVTNYEMINPHARIRFNVTRMRTATLRVGWRKAMLRRSCYGADGPAMRSSLEILSGLPATHRAMGCR